jgi:hypothetical protein
MRAPLQKDLLTKRWRTVRALEPSELQLQISVVRHLQWRCREGVIWFAVPNGELRDKRTGAKLKAMGVRPGVADLIFIWGELISTPRLEVTPQLLFLELKARGGRLSPPQIEFRDIMRKCGAPFEVADNIDDAIALLDRYGILKRPGVVA